MRLLFHIGRWSQKLSWDPACADMGRSPGVRTESLIANREPRQLSPDSTAAARRGHIGSLAPRPTPGKPHLRRRTHDGRVGRGLPYDSQQSVRQPSTASAYDETARPRIDVPAVWFSNSRCGLAASCPGPDVTSPRDYYAALALHTGSRIPDPGSRVKTDTR